MGYVRKTMTLVEEIRETVDRMKHSEVKKLYKGNNIPLDTPLHHDVRKVIEKVLWKEAPDLKDKMPEKWCKHEDTIQITFYASAPSIGVPVHFETSTDDKLRLPPTYRKYSDDCQVKEEDFTPLIREWMDDLKKQESEKRETVDMFDGIKEQLTSYMKKHASLNTAIKELPELEMYVPKNYLDKLAEETVKHKKVFPLANDDDDDEVELDMEAITRAAIAHRITSSGE